MHYGIEASIGRTLSVWKLNLLRRFDPSWRWYLFSIVRRLSNVSEFLVQRNCVRQQWRGQDSNPPCLDYESDATTIDQHASPSTPVSHIMTSHYLVTPTWSELVVWCRLQRIRAISANCLFCNLFQWVFCLFSYWLYGHRRARSSWSLAWEIRRQTISSLQPVTRDLALNMSQLTVDWNSRQLFRGRSASRYTFIYFGGNNNHFVSLVRLGSSCTNVSPTLI